MTKTTVALLLALLAIPAAAADDRATPADAEDLVRTAASLLKSMGQEKAFQEFGRKGGPFIYKDLYVAVYDTAGKCLMHGAKPEKAGLALAAQPEADQKIIKARLAAIQGKEEAWQEYVYLNPATGKEEPKVAFTIKVGDLLISAGAYKNVAKK